MHGTGTCAVQVFLFIVFVVVVFLLGCVKSGDQDRRVTIPLTDLYQQYPGK